eukprot:6018957-Alexandrium_andersonii.AAC.1
MSASLVGSEMCIRDSVASVMSANVQTDHFPLVVSLVLKLGASGPKPDRPFRAGPAMAPPGAAEAYAR